MAPKQVYRDDLMIHAVSTASGATYYLIERRPFERQGLKKAVFCLGTFTDAVFGDRAAAAAELARFPLRPEGAADQSDASVDAAADEDGA